MKGTAVAYRGYFWGLVTCEDISRLEADSHLILDYLMKRSFELATEADREKLLRHLATTELKERRDETDEDEIGLMYKWLGEARMLVALLKASCSVSSN